jgi:hypothetical protein
LRQNREALEAQVNSGDLSKEEQKTAKETLEMFDTQIRNLEQKAK